MTTIIIDDDHKIIRQGVRALLEYEPDFQVVVEACNGAEALSLVKSHRPDILLTDITMPICTGIDVAAEIKRKCWPTKVVILSMHSGEAYVAKAMASGALGYVLKEAGVECIVEAVREVMRGCRFVSPPLVLPMK